MTRELRHAFGLFLALLAVLAHGTMAVTMPAPMRAVADAGVICRQGDDGAAPVRRMPDHRPADCLLCAFCGDLDVTAAVAAPAPVVPVPRIGAIARATVPPPATAPPARIVHAARPRAPPVPV